MTCAENGKKDFLPNHPRYILLNLMSINLNPLLRTISYSFKDLALLKQALTHRSHADSDNERLEFLGDSILNFIITEELFKRFPRLNEGELSRYRASLVKEETLAIIAQNLNLGDYLQLGGGELKSGGFRRPSILADALEALIAALYFDSGIEQCRIFIHHFFAEKLDNVAVVSKQKDAKTALQEYRQAKQQSLPRYDLLTVSGEEHNQLFEIVCTIDGISHSTSAIASSRKQAEQLAAEAFLLFLQRPK
jgi:ribonuclease-3